MPRPEEKLAQRYAAGREVKPSTTSKTPVFPPEAISKMRRDKKRKDGVLQKDGSVRYENTGSERSV